MITGSRDKIDQLRDSQSIFGAVVDPTTAYNIGRGLQTLGLRVERQNTSGMAIAKYLESHPKVRLVWYPGLLSHPDHVVARKQMRGYGGVVSFEIEGDGVAASRFVDALRLPYIAPSLGGVDSLIILPAVMSYYETPLEERLALGVRDERFASRLASRIRKISLLILPRRSPMSKMILAARYPAQSRLIVSCLYQRRQGDLGAMLGLTRHKVRVKLMKTCAVQVVSVRPPSPRSSI